MAKKYYSDITKKIYDDEATLEKDEKEVEEKKVIEKIKFVRVIHYLWIKLCKVSTGTTICWFYCSINSNFNDFI